MGGQSHLRSIFGTNPTFEMEGVVIDYGEGVKIRIARAGGANVRFKKVLERVTRPFRRAIQTETLPIAKADEILREVYAEAVVLSWEGVMDSAGTPMSCSKENCLKLFAELPELFTDIQAQAGKFSLFRQDEIEADSGN